MPAIERRIIPVSSGKGGVGKTTFALNYALSLSRHGRTVLIDLDTGTSSLRNCLDTSVERDLYHFFKKGFRLADCVTPLDPRLDPRGEFKNFGFVASPRHLIEDITNFTVARREQVIDGINTLDANFIVLDLKAGLDQNVIEFLPYSNSGILVFTPHLPAATLAASDIVKAILFRKLRALFAPAAPVYAVLSGITPRFVNDLIDQVEDVYDSSVHNLDAFVADLQHALGEHPVVKLVASSVDTFMVYYVLNRFDGIKSSYETAVKPFVKSLAENVSGHLTISNLGWVVEHPQINQSNIDRVPILLARPEPAKGRSAASGREAAALKEIEKLAAQHLPFRAPRREAPGKDARTAPLPPTADPGRYLDSELETLKKMFEDVKSASYRENFGYITSRSLHVMSSRRTSDFGDVKIFKNAELQQAVHERGR